MPVHVAHDVETVESGDPVHRQRFCLLVAIVRLIASGTQKSDAASVEAAGVATMPAESLGRAGAELGTGAWTGSGVAVAATVVTATVLSRRHLGSSALIPIHHAISKAAPSIPMRIPARYCVLPDLSKVLHDPSLVMRIAVRYAGRTGLAWDTGNAGQALIGFGGCSPWIRVLAPGYASFGSSHLPRLTAPIAVDCYDVRRLA